ncbi:MAG TPA: hypothetical protein VFT50_00085 [Baekduia sp.]|nr:hypothetical protein [Baekduia sp.]
MIPSRLAAPVAALLALAVPAAARAADPVMPLAQVHADMRCTGYSVIRGTAISAFDVDVLDVLGGPDPAILARASGPAVDDTGIAEGFSGSPVKCADDTGTLRTIGAIAAGTGDYGNKLVLLTPIEAMLGEPVDLPRGTKALPRALAAAARPLASPLSFSGVSGPVADALRRAARRSNRAAYAAPAAPGPVFGPQELVPGASVAVGLSTGDIAAGAVGTVTYVDGSSVWAFGHPLDAVGRRSLLLQDAWVHTVVGNPVDSEKLTSYKLASPGHVLGTLTNDAANAVVGAVGRTPRQIPLDVTAHDLDSKRVIHQHTDIADETDVGNPTGISPLSEVAPVAVAQAAYDALHSSPTHQSGSMCVRITLLERQAPMRFCNRYVGGTPGEPGAEMAADVAEATAMIDSYRSGTIHVQRMDVNLKISRALNQAYLLGAQAPYAVRAGSSIRVRTAVQRVRGTRFHRMLRVHVPRGLAAGRHVLTLRGTPADGGGDLGDTFTIVLGGGGGGGDSIGLRSTSELARALHHLHRTDGVTATFKGHGGRTRGIVVLDNPAVRISGRARVALRVRR